MPIPPVAVAPPTHDDLVRDLALWRQSGVRNLRKLELPALHQAAFATGYADTAKAGSEPAPLVDLVRRAIANIAGSSTGRCALVLLGLDPDTFDVAPHVLREEAAEVYGVSWERFRREPQQRVLSSVADVILELAHAHQARLARLALEQRHPADTRLAVHWLERFESYFKIWTPVYALGADLTAYRETLIDPDRPYDESAETATDAGSGATPYTQEMQADGHGIFALYHLACVLDAQENFIARYGGLWLLSTPEAEAVVRDALHEAVSHTEANERDQSWLRVTLELSGGEMHTFLDWIKRDAIGVATIKEWQAWLSECDFVWVPARHDKAVEYFPTGRYHGGIRAECRVHQVIEASNRYCTTIEGEWMKVADWYQHQGGSGT